MEKQIILIDNGSGFCKLGFSGDAEPRVEIPTVIGKKKGTYDNNEENLLFGEEALDKIDDYEITRLIKKGIIENWEDMISLWEHLFKNELKIDAENCTFFITEKMQTPKKQREKMTELFFEHFKAQSIYITNGATMTLYGACKFNGIVVDSGYEFTQIVPIRNGYPFSSTIKSLNVGGKDISDYLASLLLKKGYDKIPGREIDKIKEKYCYVSLPPKIKEENEVSYELPDKRSIKLKEERHLATQILFYPNLFDKDFGGIDRKVCEAMYNADNFTKTKFSGNIVVTGGNTLFPGFIEEFGESLDTTTASYIKNRTKVIDIKQRKYLQYIGASIFSTVSIFNGLCTTKTEYDELGPTAIHNKCFYH